MHCLAWSTLQRYAAILTIGTLLLASWYKWIYKPMRAHLTYLESNYNKIEHKESLSKGAPSSKLLDTSFDFATECSAAITTWSRCPLKKNGICSTDELKIECSGNYQTLFDTLEYVFHNIQNAILVSCKIEEGKVKDLHMQLVLKMYQSKESVC